MGRGPGVPVFGKESEGPGLIKGGQVLVMPEASSKVPGQNISVQASGKIGWVPSQAQTRPCKQRARFTSNR